MLNSLRTLFSSSAPEAPVAGVEAAPSPLQIYAGYEPADADMLHRHATVPASLQGDHYIDGFGVKTLYACVPFDSPDALNLSRLEHPIPDDGFHAEGIEYVALLDAIERFASDGSFVAVEGRRLGPMARDGGCSLPQSRGRACSAHRARGLAGAVRPHAPAS